MRRCLVLIVLLESFTTGAVASDWPKYCANLEMTGVAQSGGALSAATARNLTLRWSTVLTGAIASSPTVVNGRLYIGDWSGNEFAVDASTGTILATVSLGITTQPQCSPDVLGITSSAAIDGGTLFIAGGDDSFYAIDPLTMQIRWKQRLGDNSNGYYGWCSPAVAGGYVLQGVSSNCDSPFVPGRLVQFDRNSGSFLSDRSLMPYEWPHGWAGAGVWTSPAVDIPHQTVYVTTGSANDIEDGYSFSIVRMAMFDLRIIDSWKITTAKWPDSDWGTSPTLFTDAHGHELVGAGQKDGNYYAFSRDDIADGPLWIAPLTRAGNCPQCGDGIISTAAFDGRRLYVGGGQPIGDTKNEGSITALDPASGQVRWQLALPRPVIAPISYANGVIATTTGNSLILVDAESGAILSTFAARAECFGGVAITDGGIFFGDLAGNLYCVNANPLPARRRSVR
jgi:polyvinyl alcohol dehydrogenase (cytochrome)